MTDKELLIAQYGNAAHANYAMQGLANVTYQTPFGATDSSCCMPVNDRGISLTDGPTYKIQRGDVITVKSCKGKSMFKQFQEYVSQHRDIVFSIILLALADKVFLNGALQEKIASFVKKLVEGMEKKVGATTTEVK